MSCRRPSCHNRLEILFFGGYCFPWKPSMDLQTSRLLCLRALCTILSMPNCGRMCNILPLLDITKCFASLFARSISQYCRYFKALCQWEIDPRLEIEPRNFRKKFHSAQTFAYVENSNLNNFITVTRMNINRNVSSVSTKNLLTFF